MARTALVVFLAALSISLIWTTSFAAETTVEKPSLSVIVLLQNRPSVYLRTALRALEDLKRTSISDYSSIEVILAHVGPLDHLAKDSVSAVLASRVAFEDFRFINGLPEDKEPHALNRAAEQATGDFLLFIQESIEILGSEQIQKMIEVFAASKGTAADEIAVVGNKIIEDDGTIFSAGIDFVMAKNPHRPDPFASVNWGQTYSPTPVTTSYGRSTRVGSAGAVGEQSGYNRLLGGRYGRNRNARTNPPPTEEAVTVTQVDATPDNSTAIETIPAPVEETPEQLLSSTEVPVLVHRLQGYTLHDSRVMSTQELHAVSKVSMMVPRKVFAEIGGFSEHFITSYYDVDFCLRAQRMFKKRVVYTPHSISLHHVNPMDAEGGVLADDNLDSDVVKADLKQFTLSWIRVLKPEIEDRYQIHNLTVIWSMDCGTGQVLGFTTEATNLITAFHSGVRVKVHVGNEDECKRELFKAGFPASVRKLMSILMSRENQAGVEAMVAILHKDPGRYSFLLNTEGIRDASALIGRSMYETDTIPTQWLDPCKGEVDLIWVPSRFNVETFSEAGVNVSKLDTLPETIDVYHFDPEAHDPTILPAKYSFNFLSISKWEPRKAWDVLIEAYFTEFMNEKDKVGLFIRANLNEDAEKEYTALVDKYLKRNRKMLVDLPRIHFLKGLVPYTKLPSLYKAADAFVLATHGEGWGLPLMEAMAMELPTIATNWSGNTEFMNEENSFLVSVDEMIPAPTDGHQWARPDTADLRRQMRAVYANRAEAKATGKKARQHVVSYFGHGNVKQVIIDKFNELIPRFEEFKVVHAARQSANTWNSNSWWNNQQANNAHTATNTNNNNWNFFQNQQTFEDAEGNTRVKVRIND